MTTSPYTLHKGRISTTSVDATGRHLAPRLTAEGWTVQVASRHPRQEEAYAAAVRMVTVAADLGAEEQVRRAVTGAEGNWSRGMTRSVRMRGAPVRG
jgi:NAD(P)-dependent dehydrogenase (short-subunit alcohol dehydrogenase family)